jgi:hypothetical protein
MARNIRFVDNLKVGSYAVESNVTSTNIENNVNNYVLTATGQNKVINGEAQLQFDGINLGIGGASTGARLEIKDTTGRELLLIKNSTTNQGIQVNNAGVLSLTEFITKPTAVEGGIIYNFNEFWIGVNS